MKLALFEFEGAIVDKSFAMSVDKCFGSTLLNVIGIDESVDSWGNNKGFTEAGLFFDIFQRHMGRPPSQGEWGNMRRTFAQSLKQEMGQLKVVAGAEKIFGLLNAAGWKTGVFVNSWKEAGESKLEYSNIELDHISIMAFSDGELLQKKHLIQKTVDIGKNSAGGQLEKVVIIGGSLDTEAAAKELGLPFVGIGAHFKAPTVMFPQLTDAQGLISKL